MVLLRLNHRLLKVCLLSLIRGIVNEWPIRLYRRTREKYLLRLDLIGVMHWELIISDLFNNHHVTVTILYWLLLSHKISRLIDLPPTNVVTSNKRRLAGGHHWLRGYTLEVIPRPLALLASRSDTHELRGFDGCLWLTLVETLLTRLLMFLDHLVEDLVVRVLRLLLVTMEVGAGGVLVQIYNFLLVVYRGVALRDLLLLLGVHVVEVYCWGTTDILDMYWSMQVSGLTLVIVNSCGIVALLHVWVVMRGGSV